MEHAADEIDKQTAIDKITEVEEQTEWIFYGVSSVLLFLLVISIFLKYIDNQKKSARILRTSNNSYLEHLNDNKRLLDEIAHIQSHDVRGPLSSILGLMQFFNYDNLADPLNKELMEGISDSAVKLDAIIKKVVFKTYEK